MRQSLSKAESARSNSGEAPTACYCARFTLCSLSKAACFPFVSWPLVSSISIVSLIQIWARRKEKQSSFGRVAGNRDLRKSQKNDRSHIERALSIGYLCKSDSSVPMRRWPLVEKPGNLRYLPLSLSRSRKSIDTVCVLNVSLTWKGS